MTKIRCSFIPAWYAKDMLNREVTPEEIVHWCEYYDGEWKRIECDEKIDEVLDSWEDIETWAMEMTTLNFGFIPMIKLNRGAPSGNPLPPTMVDPLFHAILANGYATINELRTIYSLRDAFLMLDSITTTKINEYLAMQEAKSGR